MAVSREAQHGSQKHNGDENMEKGGKKERSQQTGFHTSTIKKNLTN